MAIRLLLAGACLVGLAAPVIAAAPPTLTVPAGTEVTWVNRDDIPHLLAATDGQFRSPPLDTDDSFTARLTTPGEVDYFCSLHPHMTGKLIVTAPP
jgi:plastocyanin